MRILAFAYACEPGEGSEPGAGWAWARMLAGMGETWVITRANNKASIESVLPHTPEQRNLHFIYVDLPAWARFWKKGRRGIYAYYVLWQFAALRRARELCISNDLDLVWHLTLTTVWIGSVGGSVGPPFVYGPIGGGVRVPTGSSSVLGMRGTLSEAIRTTVSTAARHLNPLARRAWRGASIILVQNDETRNWLPRTSHPKIEVMPNVVLTEIPPTRERSRATSAHTALFAGRLLPWKGAALAIEAMHWLPDWDLLIAGDGSDRRRLERLVDRMDLAQRVTFLGAVPRPEILRLMREEADVFLFPSLREEAGWVVSEAVSSGVPAVCLDRGGPRELGAIAVPFSTKEATAEDLAQGVRQLAGSTIPAPPFDIDTRAQMLPELLSRHGLIPTPTGTRCL